MHFDNYKQYLKAELERRKEFNEMYSLRSFAKDLEISAPRLSQILSGKSGLSCKAAASIAKKLKLDNKKRDWFVNSAGAEHSRGSKDRQKYQKRFQEIRKKHPSFTEIEIEYFRVISDWYHYAILELTYLEDFKSDPVWMANTLGIEKKQVQEAIVRLLKLGLLKESNGVYKDCFINLETTNDIPADSIKKFNNQLMKKAAQALFHQDVLEREISSNVMAIAKEDLPFFKEKIRQFKRTFTNDIPASRKMDDIYGLNIQFFSLTKQEVDYEEHY